MVRCKKKKKHHLSWRRSSALNRFKSQILSNAESCPLSYFTINPSVKFFSLVSFCFRGYSPFTSFLISLLCYLSTLPLKFVSSFGFSSCFLRYSYSSMFGSYPLVLLYVFAFLTKSRLTLIFTASLSAIYPYYFLLLASYLLNSKLALCELAEGV